jgi:hypothetical protein
VSEGSLRTRLDHDALEHREALEDTLEDEARAAAWQAAEWPDISSI